MIEFIPGKKYKWYNGYVYFFVGLGSEGTRIFENEGALGTWHDDGPACRWTEYKEPIVHKRYIHWFRNPTSQDVWAMFSTAPLSPNSTDYYIKTDTVQYVES